MSRSPLWIALLAVLSLSACSTHSVKPEINLPEPTPPECRRETIEARFPAALAKLPANFLSLPPDDQARALLNAKASDAEAYFALRALAVRCAE